MKKLIFLYGIIAILFNSCVEDDTQYVDTTFILNTPALANQYYELTEDGTVDLSWSQPFSNYADETLYKVQVSLEESFLDFMELSTEYEVCYAQVSSKEIAEAICKLRGITSEEEYTDEPARPVYFRVNAYVEGHEDLDVISNVIKLNQVKGYCAIQSPGFIYLIGSVGGWTGPDAGNAGALAEWRLFEADDAIGSKIYSATFNMPAGSLTFRFYTELTGWDGGASVGTQVDDNPITVDMSSGKYSGVLVAPGKGSIQVDNWDGSPMKITVDLNVNSVLLEKVVQ